jgi:hypothetical protein
MSVQVEFREVGTTGVFMAHTEANQKNSMKLLQQNGFRALTYQEAFITIDKNPELKKQLKGKWFYLDGKGWTEQSRFHTFNENGELAKGKGNILVYLPSSKAGLEKTVYVLKGSQPLSLLVHTDDFARYGGFRFLLPATYSKSASDVAGVVVGVEI